MLYRNHLVFLPRYNDHGLYERLRLHGEEVSAVFKGKEYPWPTEGPTLFHDLGRA